MAVKAIRDLGGRATPAVKGAEPSLGPVAARVDAVCERIRLAGGKPGSIRIVAVTKGFGPDAVAAAIEAGLTDVGENFADELVAKQRAAAGSGPPCRWHFLGRVQRNKVSRLAPAVSLWQGVDRISAGQEIARRAPGAHVLVQVNVSDDPTRNGCRIEAVPALVDELTDLDLDVAGLMAIGPRGAPEDARPGFRAVATMAQRLGLVVRSMGMTDDLEVAVQEGTTMVRVGRALFGERLGGTVDGRLGEVQSRSKQRTVETGPEIPPRDPSLPGSGDRLTTPRRRG